MAHHQAYTSSGMAIFSTRAGQHCQRRRIPGMSLVIRSDPNDDRDTMAAKLQAQFPTICRNITTFGHRGDAYVNDYFDEYDQQLQGQGFLRAVLLHIAHSNATRAREVQDLSSRWMATNTDAFALLGPEHLVEHVFTKEDIEQYEMGLLVETLILLQHAAAFQNAVRLQEQHQPVLHEYGESVLSREPNLTKISSQRPALPTSRVIPPPVNRYPTPQGRYPQQRLTSSTEVLEHTNLGSTNRGDFHSDSTTNTFNSPYMNYNMAIPSLGLPGPFSYGSLPRVSLSERQRNYNSIAQPKGKKNPAKKSTDDARKAGQGGSSRRQSSKRRISENFGVLHLVESPPSINPLREDQFTLMQIGPAFQGGVRSGHTVTDSLGRPEGVMLQDGPLRIADSGQGPQYTEPHHSTQAHEFNMHTLDPHAFGRQTPNTQPALQDPVNLAASDGVGPRHPSEADHGQLQHQQASKYNETRASKWVEREYLRGNKIWVGNIPIAFKKSMVEELLEPCRGLQRIVEPRTPSQGSNVHTYVFAHFCAQDEAEEALDRLPQTHFKCLGEGNFLKTSWPLTHNSNRPQNQRTYDARIEQARRHTPPTTTRKGKASDGTVIGEVGEETSHPQEESVKLRVVGESVTDATVVESNITPQLDSIQAPSMAVPTFDSTHPTAVSALTRVAPSSAATVSSENRSSAAAYNRSAGQANQAEEPASSQSSLYDRGPSSVDGTSDPTHNSKPTVHSEQESYGPSSRQPDNCRKLPTTSTKNIKKSDQTSRSSSKLQGLKETQHCGAVSLSENIKPTATTEATTASIANACLGEAAHQDFKNDAAKALNAEVEGINCVAALKSLPTITAPKTQLLMNSSILTTPPKEATHPASPEYKKRASAPIIDSTEQKNATNSITEAGLPVKPLSNVTPIRVKCGESTLGSSQPIYLDPPLEEEQEPAAHIMSRDGSNSTNVADSGESLDHFSTAPTSYLQTERSNSLADGSRTSITHSNESSPTTQTRGTGVDPEQLRSILQTDIKAAIGSGHIIEPRGNTVAGESLEAFAPDMSDFSPKSQHKPTVLQQENAAGIVAIDKDTESIAAPFLDKASRGPTVALSPHISALAIEPAESQGPEREQLPVISARSSSLPRLNPSTVGPAPILTRHTKQKSRNPKTSVPAEEKGGSSGSKNMADLAEKQSIDAGLTSSEQRKPPSSILDANPHQSQISKPKREEFEDAPILTIEPGLCSSSPTKLVNLPDPETPFELDGQAVSLVVRGLCQRDSEEGQPSAGYDLVAQCDALQLKRIATDLPLDMRVAMEEAGYMISLFPSSARHFAVKDPILARFGNIFEEEEQRTVGESKDDKIQFSEKGKTFVMDRAEMQKQIEMRAFLGKAAAGKRLEEGLSPRTPTKDRMGKSEAGEDDPPIQSLRDRIEKIAMHNILVKAGRGERNVGDSLEDRMAKEGRILLDTSPTHRSSKKSSIEWIDKAEQYVKGSQTPVLPLLSTPTPVSKTGDFHQSSASLMRSLQQQGKLPEGSPVVTTKAGSKTAVIKLKPGEDASQIAADHLANPDALFGTDMVKLSSLEEIRAAFAKPGGAVTPLSSEERQTRNSAQSEPLEKKAVGYWNQNSGFKDSDVQDGLLDEGSDGSVVRSQNEDVVSAIQSYDSLSKLSKTQDTGASREPTMNQIPSVRTSRDQCEEAPRHVCDQLGKLAVLAAEAHANGQQVDDLASSPRTVTGDYSDAEANNVKSILGSERGGTTGSRQDDAEYPVLPRGRSNPVKGGESRAPSKGGYAAAARKSIDEKLEKEAKRGMKAGNMDIKEDPWAPGDVWGPGTGVSRGYARSRG